MQKIYFYIVFLSTPCAYAAAGGGGAASGDSVRSSREHAYQYSTDPEGKGDNHFGVIGFSWVDSGFKQTVQEYCKALKEDTSDKTREKFKNNCIKYKKERAKEFYNYDCDSINQETDHFLWWLVFEDEDHLKDFEMEILKDDEQLDSFQDVFINIMKRDLYEVVSYSQKGLLRNKYKQNSPYLHFADFRWCELESLFDMFDLFRRGVNPLVNEKGIDKEMFEEYTLSLHGFIYYSERSVYFSMIFPGLCQMYKDFLEPLEALSLELGSKYDEDRKYYKEPLENSEGIISIQKVVRGYLARKKAKI